MATIIIMPAVVADATEAAIQQWLVAVGDTIVTGQPLAEIETEKATVELEAETNGIVGRLLVKAGASVEVGEPIAVLIDSGEDEASIDGQIAAASSATESASQQPVPSDTEAPTLTAHENETLTGKIQSSTDRVFSSPIARKIAKESGVDISTLNGSGPNGRILRSDVELASSQDASAAPHQEDLPAPAKASVPRSEQSPPAQTNYEEFPLSGMRRAIARRLTESKSTVPHFYLSIDVSMDDLFALRRQINEGFESTGLKVTVNDLVLKALGGALADTPAANATWHRDSIRRYSSVDVSVAIATGDGLLTPVIRGLDKLSVSALVEVMTDYKERASAGRIKQQELEGGTFSLTNLGMYGTKEFSAILNPPQAGILAVGVAEQRPVVRDGGLAIATLMTCTLSADHRVIDGAVGAQLLLALKHRIENPLSLLL